ncbi:type II toxin-antitoxin system RelE family toxin [Methanosphaera sp.]|jgi:mRNA-degrading endonuclease RelE of RelBE toxin-antitoxin system|uniref:type II toxin-antitoxin system RelE family toxin n=1 Tax=Methanosphaera sp. TaxID=2666342 RepID=UPI003D8ABE89
MKILLNKNTEKTLNKLKKKNPVILQQVSKTIEEISKNPNSNKYEKVVKYPSYKRARSGKYRICFKTLDETTLYIARIAKRSKVYS